MPYIGKTPTVGNFQVCDAISVVNGQAAYALQVGGVNVAPESANHMLVSLNGILQKPGSSFTISGSTMTFASNLATGDVIDFVQILGNVLDIGQPSDDTVTAAKLNNDIISGQTALASEPADTDEFLVSDAGTLKRIDYSLIKGGGAFEHLLTTTASDSANITFNSTYITTTYLDYMIVMSGMKGASDGAQAAMLFSVDNGSNYLSDYQLVVNGRGAGNNDRFRQSQSSSDLRFNGNTAIGGATGEGFAVVVKIFDPMKQSGTTDIVTMFNAQQSYISNSGELTVTNAAGCNAVTTAVNNIKFEMTSGNIESGKVSLYGRKVS